MHIFGDAKAGVNSFQHIGKFLIIAGIVIIITGAILMLFGKASWFSQYFGKLPGDFVIQRKNFTLYVPIATSILLSILLTIILWIIWRK